HEISSNRSCRRTLPALALECFEEKGLPVVAAELPRPLMTRRGALRAIPRISQIPGPHLHGIVHQAEIVLCGELQMAGNHADFVSVYGRPVQNRTWASLPPYPTKTDPMLQSARGFSSADSAITPDADRCDHGLTG